MRNTQKEDYKIFSEGTSDRSHIHTQIQPTPYLDWVELEKIIINKTNNHSILI